MQISSTSQVVNFQSNAKQPKSDKIILVVLDKRKGTFFDAGLMEPLKIRLGQENIRFQQKYADCNSKFGAALCLGKDNLKRIDAANFKIGPDLIFEKTNLESRVIFVFNQDENKVNDEIITPASIIFLQQEDYRRFMQKNPNALGVSLVHKEIAYTFDKGTRKLYVHLPKGWIAKGFFESWILNDPKKCTDKFPTPLVKNKSIEYSCKGNSHFAGAIPPTLINNSLGIIWPFDDRKIINIGKSKFITGIFCFHTDPECEKDSRYVNIFMGGNFAPPTRQKLLAPLDPTQDDIPWLPPKDVQMLFHKPTSTQDSFSMLLLPFAKSLLVVLGLLQIAKSVSRKIASARTAQEMKNKLEIKQKIIQSTKTLFDNLEKQLKEYTSAHTVQADNSITIRQLHPLLLTKMKNIFSAPPFTVTNPNSGELKIKFNYQNSDGPLPSTITRITELETELIQIFSSLSDALLNQKRLSMQENLLKDEQQTLDRRVATLKASLSQKEGALQSTLMKLKPQDLDLLEFSNSRTKATICQKLNQKQLLLDTELDHLVVAYDALKHDTQSKVAKLGTTIKNLFKNIKSIKSELERLRPADNDPDQTSKQQKHLESLKEIADQNLQAHLKKLEKKQFDQTTSTHVDNGIDLTKDDATTLEEVTATEYHLPESEETKKQENLLILREFLIGVDRVRVQEFKPRPQLQQVINYFQCLLKDSCNDKSLDNVFKSFQQQYPDQFNEVLTNAKCDENTDEETKARKLKQYFHQQLESVIENIINQSSLENSKTNQMQIQRCLYLFLDLCFNDKDNVLETYQIVHHFRKDHALTGAGHASKKHSTHLQIQCFILSQFLNPVPTSDLFKRLPSLTYNNFKEFLTTSWSDIEGHCKVPAEFKIVNDISKNDLKYLTDLISFTQKDTHQCPTTLPKVNSILNDFFERVCHHYMNNLSYQMNDLTQKGALSEDETSKLANLELEMEQSGVACAKFTTSNKLDQLIANRNEFNLPTTLVDLLHFLNHPPKNVTSNLTAPLPSMDSLREDLTALYKLAYLGHSQQTQ